MRRELMPSIVAAILRLHRFLRRTADRGRSAIHRRSRILRASGWRRRRRSGECLPSSRISLWTGGTRSRVVPRRPSDIRLSRRHAGIGLRAVATEPACRRTSRRGWRTRCAEALPSSRVRRSGTGIIRLGRSTRIHGVDSAISRVWVIHRSAGIGLSPLAAIVDRRTGIRGGACTLAAIVQAWTTVHARACALPRIAHTRAISSRTFTTTDRSLSAALDRVLKLRAFLVKRRTRSSRRPCGREEMIWLRRMRQRRGSRWTSTSAQALPVRDHRQIAGRQPSIRELLLRDRARRDVPSAEIIGGHGRNRVPEVLVVRCHPHVGKTRVSVAQRWQSTVNIVDVSNVGDVYNVEVRAVPAPPGKEGITRSERQPANRAPSEADAEAESATKSEEGDVRWCPHWLIESAINRAWPPTPSVVIVHPAAIVIWRPSPRLIRGPSPSPVRFVDPLSIAVRGPTRRL
jgi:hypothetical protein